MPLVIQTHDLHITEGISSRLCPYTNRLVWCGVGPGTMGTHGNRQAGSDSPVSPESNIPQELALSTGEKTSGHRLLGFWDLSYNFDTHEFDIVPLRSSDFHLNAVMYVQTPMNLGVDIVSENYTTGEFIVDVTLTHPFPGTNLMGFDVKGIVFGTGPETLQAKDDPDLMWLPVGGLRLNNADGWTRWWNQDEFGTPGMFGFTEGIFGTSGVNFHATLNPYKYFSTALGLTTPVIPHILDNRGSFWTNVGPAQRRYELVFPLVGGFPDPTFQYAVDACWNSPYGEGPWDPDDFPPDANCEEPFYIAVDASKSTVFYHPDGAAGGDVVLDLEVFDWGGADGFEDEITAITINSDSLFSYYYDAPLSPWPGSSPLSRIYHVSIPNVNPTGFDNQEVMVSVKAYGGYAPPFAGSQFPSSEQLTAYTIATVPVLAFEPEKIGGFGPVGAGELIDIKVIGNIAYVLDTVDGLGIYNVTNPDDPILLMTVPLPSTPVRLDVEAGYAYIIDQAGQFVVVDVSPIQDAAYSTALGLFSSLISIDAQSTEAYVCTQAGNLHILDIDPPTTPSLLNTVPIACIGPASEVRVVDGYAYVGDDLDVIDVDPPGSAGSVKVVTTPSTIISVDYDEATDYVFCGDNTNSMHVMDASNPVNTNTVDSINLGGPVNSIKVQGDLIYATVGNEGFKVCAFNETTESTSLVGEVTLANPGVVTSEGNIAYVINNGAVDIIKVWDEEPKSGWGINWGANADDFAQNVAIDSSGNIYVCGEYEGTVDFDPSSGVYNVSPIGGKDCFLAKYDSTGAIQWAYGWGSAGNDDQCIDVKVSGNYVWVIGGFYGTVDFDPGGATDNRTSNGLQDAYFVKYQTDGTYIYAWNWGGGSGYDDLGTDLAIDGNGNVYMCGYFSGTNVDFDEGSDFMSSNGAWDAFILKRDSSMNLLWTSSWGGASSDQAYGVACTDNAVFICGYFCGTVDFDPTGTTENHTATGTEDMYVCKYSADGTYLWTITWGGTGSPEYIRDVALIRDEFLFLTGVFSSTVDFDPGVGVQNRNPVGGNSDGFVMRVLQGGAFQNVLTWGSTGADNALCVETDNNDSIYITGGVANDCDFDSAGSGYVLPAMGTLDFYVVKINIFGYFEWARRWGGSGSDSCNGRGLCFEPISNAWYLVGNMQGTVDFDPGSDFDYHVSDSGTADAFLIKMTSEGNW